MASRWRVGSRTSSVVISEEQAIRLAVLAQYPSWEITDPDTRRNRRNLEAMRALLACLRAAPHQIIDLIIPLQQVWQDDPERFRFFYSGHMTAAGNAFIADIVSRSIASTPAMCLRPSPQPQARTNHSASARAFRLSEKGGGGVVF